jgi:hypothetical protein
MASPTGRTLQYLRNIGWVATVVESWVPVANIRRDLFGMFDLLAVRPDVPGVVGIQTTSASNHAARRTKLLASPILKPWLMAANGAEIWSWDQHNGRWEVRREALTLDDALEVTALPLTPRRRPRRQRRGERQGDLFQGQEALAPECEVSP